MSLILMIREEIVCLIILLFILLFSRLYKMGKDRGDFLRICIFAIGHTVFDLITVITVNSPDVVPEPVNHICHIVFYMFALLFTYEFFCYTVTRCYPKAVLRKARIFGLIPLGLYLVAVPFLPMSYLVGDGTYYSFGTAAFIGYGVAMLFFVLSLVLVFVNIKKLDTHIIGSLLPMLGTAISAEIIQIAIPEMLFTGGAVTIVTVGFFFSLENPVAVLRHKVLFDALTGVKSRHSYEAEIIKYEKKFAGGTRFGMVFCDINDLKAVNDTYGHIEGDNYIGCIAQILMGNLLSADAIYRMGGDEFLAVYLDNDINLIRNETTAVHVACREQSREHQYQVSVALGYSVSDSSSSELRDVMRAADFRMYANKSQFKKQRAYLLSGSDELNITGLTDRIFDAFASTDNNRFLFVNNLSTNVTRWSHSAVEYFGLKSDFIYDCNSVWMERIHPDDRKLYLDDIMAVISENQKFHDVQYRMLNANKEYVNVSCSGTILRGKHKDPDLFAGTLIVLGIDETVDHTTDFRNGYEMINHFNYLLKTRTSAALLKLSILNLNRINMLYGYVCGNEIIKQFAEVMRSVVGAQGSIFRIEGTKFLISLPGMTRDGVTELYRSIRKAAEQQIHVDVFTPPLQLAGGAYMLTETFTGTSSVLRSNLIFAHSRSKYEQRGRLIIYDDSTYSSPGTAGQHNELLLKIHQDAISDFSGFFLVYQPIVRYSDRKIVGAEALIRWKNEEFGLVSPDSFIPWLEDDPSFFRLGNWILKKALSEAKKMLDVIPEFTLNVNIAMQQLEHDGFRDAVLGILEETGFPANRLCLELTERCRELGEGFLKREIDVFRSHGIRIALDDLGTGFSSFSLLLGQNIDEVKLDRAFVREIQSKPVNQVLTRMIIEASNSIGCFTCLEGVEDEGLCGYLANYGATYYQGYYCSKPLPIDEFSAHTDEWNSGLKKQ